MGRVCFFGVDARGNLMEVYQMRQCMDRVPVGNLSPEQMDPKLKDMGLGRAV